MISDFMIVEGDSETNPRIDDVEAEQRMGFLPSMIIDQR
jgi:cyanophycinase